MEILLVRTDWTSVGGGESCMQIFSHEVEWWDRRREKESLAGILFPHMERKRFGDERASCRYGERCIISHLACRARYSMEEAELRACIAGLYIGSSLHNPIILETDCAFVVASLASGVYDRSAMRDLKMKALSISKLINNLQL